MYESVLFIHSWLRWGVVISTVVLFVWFAFLWIRGREWAHDDWISAFNQLFLSQVAFGLTLWAAASPVVRAAFRNPGLILSEPVLQFWVLRHPLTMLFALSIVHVGRVWARCSPTPARVYTVVFALVLVAIASAIPWPFLSYGRTLVRGL